VVGGSQNTFPHQSLTPQPTAFGFYAYYFIETALGNFLILKPFALSQSSAFLTTDGCFFMLLGGRVLGG